MLEVKVISKTDSENEIPYLLKETDSDSKQWEYTFFLRENFRVIKNLEGIWLFNPKCYFTERKNITDGSDSENIGKEFSLIYGFDRLRFKLGIKLETNDDPNDLKDLIYLDTRKLHDLLNE